MIKKIAFNRNSEPDFCNVIRTVLNQSTATTWVISSRYRELADKFMLYKGLNEFSNVMTKKLKVFGIEKVSVYNYHDSTECSVCYEFMFMPSRNAGIRIAKRIFFTTQFIYNGAFKTNNDVLFLEI